MKLRWAFVLGFYGVMAGAAVLWAALRGDPGLLVQSSHGVLGLTGGAAAGVGLGLLTALLSRWAVERFAAARRLAGRMGEMLGPLDRASIVLLAVCSAVAEELLFRGAMQPSWGLVITSLLFGAAHIGPDRSYLPWTAMAIVLGFALGGLMLLSGCLLGPILAHFTINYFNLHLVDEVRRRLPD